MVLTERYILGIGTAIAVSIAALISQSDSAHADIKIGVFGPLSGDAAAFGQSERQGVDLAVNKKNAAGGVLGQKIQVIYGDDAGKPEQALSVAKRLTTSDGVHIL